MKNLILINLTVLLLSGCSNKNTIFDSIEIMEYFVKREYGKYNPGKNESIIICKTYLLINNHGLCTIYNRDESDDSDMGYIEFVRLDLDTLEIILKEISGPKTGSDSINDLRPKGLLLYFGPEIVMKLNRHGENQTFFFWIFGDKGNQPRKLYEYILSSPSTESNIRQLTDNDTTFIFRRDGFIRHTWRSDSKIQL